MPRYRAYGGPQDGVMVTLASGVAEWVVPYPGQMHPSNIAGANPHAVEAKVLVAIYRVDQHPEHLEAALLFTGDVEQREHGYA